MTTYIDVRAACTEVDKGDLLVGNNAEWAKEIINRTPKADVVPRKVIEEIFEDIENLIEKYYNDKYYTVADMEYDVHDLEKTYRRSR